MNGQTTVSVHLVEDGVGATGPRVGGARLVHRQLVVMDAALSRDLLGMRGSDVGLRFAISGSDGTRPVLEVIDAKGEVLTLIAEGAPHDVVGVALRWPTNCLPDEAFASEVGVVQGGAAESERRLAARTSDSADAALPGDGVDPGTANWVCRLFRPPPWFCGEHQTDPVP